VPPTAVPPTAVPPTAVPPTAVPPLPPPYALGIQVPPALANQSPLLANTRASRRLSVPFAGILLLIMLIGENRRIYRQMHKPITQLIDRFKRIMFSRRK
jgi:hypothetical protein